MKNIIFAVLTSSFCCSFVAAENLSLPNWPQWRGPQGNGLAAPGEYPTEFSANEHVVWKIKLPGRGNSTPAVWEEQIFVTCPIGNQDGSQDGNQDGVQDGLLCYNFDGDELWRKQFGPERKGKHRNGTGSNPSPVTDGKHVVAYYKSGTLACLNFAGKLLWEKNLQEIYGEDTLWFDLGTSPLLAAGNIVIAVVQADDSYLVALDIETGKEAWQQARNFTCPEESDQSYASPYAYRLDGREVIVTWGADHLTGHEAATGKLLWQCGGFNPDNQSAWRVIASAAGDDRVAIVPSGRGKYLAGIDMRQASGDITSSHRLWEKAGISTDVPTPIIHGEQVLLLTDKGEVHCLDKMTGNELWSDKLPRDRDKYYASPVLAGNTLYCARQDGVIMTSTVDNGLQNIQENDMGESLIANPIPLRGKLLVRGEKHLFLIGK